MEREHNQVTKIVANTQPNKLIGPQIEHIFYWKREHWQATKESLMRCKSKTYETTQHQNWAQQPTYIDRQKVARRLRDSRHFYWSWLSILTLDRTSSTWTGFRPARSSDTAKKNPPPPGRRPSRCRACPTATPYISRNMINAQSKLREQTLNHAT